MGRLTKYGKTSHDNKVCCTHFMSVECRAVGGDCAYGCRWEEEAWSKLAHYEDLEEQGRLIEQKNGAWNENTFAFCSICSECGVIVDSYAIKRQSGKLNYCPNCGAKMGVE